jgi:hypothetical protein
MPKPVSDANITTTSNQPGQPYDAASEGPLGPWQDVSDNSGKGWMSIDDNPAHPGGGWKQV